MKEKIIQALIHHSTGVAVSSVVALIVLIASQIPSPLLYAIPALIPKKILPWLLLISPLLNVAAFIYLIRKSEKLICRFGVYWDQKNIPHCPLCKKPLSTYSKHGYLNNEYFCNPCNHLVYLSNEMGETITRKEAINNLQSK